MKKTILFIGLSLVALACTKVDVEQQAQPEIGFKAYTHKPTKTAAVSGPINSAYYGYDMPDFKVFAAYSTGDAATASDITYVDNALVTKDEANEIWVSTPKSYWPVSGSLTFMAYSPSELTGTFVPGTKTLTLSGYNITNQWDVLYSKPETATGLKAHNKDYEPSNGVNAKDTEGVDIVFTHALAQVLVKAKAKANQEPVGFVITGLKVLSENATTMTAVANAAPTWNNSGNWTSANFALEGSAQTVTGAPSTVTGTALLSAATTEYVAVSNGLLVFPQTLYADSAAKGQKLLVSYVMTYNGVYAGTVTDKEVVLGTGDFTSFEAGKKYILNLTLSAEEILYAPRVTEWIDGGSEEYDVE